MPNAELKGRDLVVFSNDWHGDPLSKTHIARILARDNRLLWINSLGNRAPKASSHDAKRALTKLARFALGMREVERNIHVLEPLALPLLGSDLVHLANRAIVRPQVLRAMKRLKFREPISWSFLPSSAPLSGSLGEELVVYHCVDEFSAFADADAPQIQRLEQQLLRRADLVVTSAEPLRERKARWNPETALVRHGVDFQHFVRACDARTEVPPDLEALPRPVIGFFGLIADWVDLDAFAAIARRHPKASVAIIGKVSPGVDVEPLRSLPNVHFLGQKPYSLLPGYCRGMDVALLNFKVNELTRHANPLKVREYVAAGLPVVATPLPEVERLGLCTLARTPEEFAIRVGEHLNRGEVGPSRERAQRIAHESWEARVEELSGLVTKALARRQSDRLP